MWDNMGKIAYIHFVLLFIDDQKQIMYKARFKTMILICWYISKDFLEGILDIYFSLHMGVQISFWRKYGKYSDYMALCGKARPHFVTE